MNTRHLFFLFPLVLAACNPGAAIPTENVRDYNVRFHSADASESCPDALHLDADALEEFSETYRTKRGLHLGRTAFWVQVKGLQEPFSHWKS